MKFHKNRFLTTVAAAALALAVGACSSSSDDDETVAAAAPPPATTEPAPEPTPELTPAEQLAAAEAAVTIAEALVAALTSSSTGDEAATAYAALGAAQTALHAATSMPANQIDALQAQINQLVLDLEAANATPSTETVALETAQADAATAAMEAMEAATAAKVASDAAQTARENIATLQTGETSGALAHAAYAQAKAAADAAAAAQTASDAAAEATDSGAATRHLVAAETARDNAVAAQGMAETQGAAAVAATMAELKIDGTVKTVGDTNLDAEAGSSVVVTGEGADAQTVRTGLIKSMNPMTTGPGVPEDEAAVFVEAMPAMNETAAVVGVAHKQAVAPRTFAIGKVVDSADDMARLMIVTQYDGTKSVKVYAHQTGTDLEGRLGSDGRIQTVGVTSEATDDDVFVSLKSVGTYHLAGLNTENDGLLFSDEVGAKATGKEVFSYVNDQGNTDAEDDVTAYVVLGTESTTESVTTVTYRHVDITVDGPLDEDSAATQMEVNASIPEATDYKHIHFGAWAALGDAKSNGTQAPANLGIGFVQSIGDGLTGADMPNNGTASFDGNWVANVQRADPDGNGTVALRSGDASVSANFNKAEITATLMGLTTLEGAIDTNTFSGSKATVMAEDPHGLDSDGKFTGSFSGGFYGAKAAEAGGVFDFTSVDSEDGAFRGAFGADRKFSN